MLKNILVMSFFALMSWGIPLKAEVQRVTIRWIPGFCNDTCSQGLQQQLNRIAGVSAVEMTGSASQATLIWRPNAPFAYQPIENAMAWIGVSVDIILVKVRGTIIHQNEIFSLISLGDNTRFDLLGNIVPQEGQFIIQENTMTHILPDYLQKQLLDAEKKHQVVTIEGPIFEPERSPPLQLIVQQAQVLQPQQAPKYPASLPKK